MQGRDLRRPPVHPRGLLRLRRRHAAVRRRAGGQRAPATPATTPASSGPSGPGPEPRAAPRWPAPPAPSSTRWPPSYTVVPVWRELLADLITPGGGVRPALPRRRARLPARVGRARRALESLVVRRSPRRGHPRRRGGASRSRSTSPCRTRSRSTRASWPRSRPCWPATGRPPLDELPPLHSGLIGYLGYDVVREVEHLPDVPADDRGCPDAVLSIIGELAAFDHFRQRVTLVANAWIAARRRPPTTSTAPTTRPSPASTSWRSTVPARSTSPWSSRPTVDDELPEVTSAMGRRALPARRSRWPRSTSWPATSSRSCCRSASTSTSTPTRSTSTGCCARSTRARTCTSCACPS